MRVRRLEIANFRGIKKLDWTGIGETAALVGPGDAGKTSVLDALERVLSPRWNHPFDDTDFWQLDTSNAIVIRATLTDLPKDFLRDSKFGLALHAVEPATGYAHAPTGDKGEVLGLVVQLKVEDNLEPIWQVIDSEDRAHMIGARDREALGMLRVGGYVDSHLTWSRGSVLTRLTETGDAVSAVLADATRKARSSLDSSSLDSLKKAAFDVEASGKEFGVSPGDSLVPHLDVSSLSVKSGALTLHDGKVPVRRAGLGTRRLLTMAMQTKAVGTAGLTLVDEFEHGLEPHRIRKLLRALQGVPPEKEERGTGQLVLSTHSPVVISEVEPASVWITRRTADGSTTVESLPDAVRYVVTRAPHALLAKRVVVGEGATEEGFILALTDAWEGEGQPSLAYLGVAVVDAEGGTQPAEVAGHLASLGYKTALLIDSDAKAKASKARDKGARVLAWPGGVSTEQRLAADLSEAGFAGLLALAAYRSKAKNFRSVRDALAGALKLKPAELGDIPDDWPSMVENDKLREVVGAASKKKEWFKSREHGRMLGQLAAEDAAGLVGTPTEKIIAQLKTFVLA